MKKIARPKKETKKDKRKSESEKSNTNTSIPSGNTENKGTLSDPILSPNPNAAVYYQRTKVYHEEFKLIGVVIDREEVVKQLENIVREVKEGRKDCGDDVILETFRLFNVVRRLTFKVIKAISIWQDSFTRQLRPIVFQGDYIIEKLIKYIDFINSSKLKKIFNFQFYRGNVLLLPYPSLKEEDPIKVPPALGKEIKDFAFPSEDEVVQAYTVLYNTLPEDIYREKVVSLEKWLIEPWVPRIWISTNNGDQPYFQSNGRPNKPKPTDLLDGAAAETAGSEQNNKSGSPSKNNSKSLTKGGKGSNSLKLSPLRASGTAPGAARKSMKNNADGTAENNNNFSPLSPAQRKRRNQLVKAQAQDMSALTDLAQVEAQKEEEEARKLAALEAEQEEERQSKIKQAQMFEIDSYYDGLQSQFLSTRKRTESPELAATAPGLSSSTDNLPRIPINPLTPNAITRSVPINFIATLHSENSLVEDADDLVEELLKGEPADKKTDKKSKQKDKKKDKKNTESSKADAPTGGDTASVASSQAPSIETASFESGTANNSLEASEENSLADSVAGEGSLADEGNSDDDSVTEGTGKKLSKGVSRKFSDFDSDILSLNNSRKIQEVKPKNINYNALSKLLKPDNSQPTVSIYGRPLDTKKKLSDLRVSTKFVRTWYKVENQIT